jgi:hypothetical protein
MFALVQDTKVRIVRGSSQKSHVVSPIDLRLSSYWLILNSMNYQKTFRKNAFNILDKSKYLPSL